MVDSSSRIGLKASRRIRKFATRIAARPIASSSTKKGNRVRPEKFRVIRGPPMAPAAMITLLATTTFWNVVRFRCHHRGSNEGLTAHFRHRSEALFGPDLRSVTAVALSGLHPMAGAVSRPTGWVKIDLHTFAPSPLFSGPLPQRPAFLFRLPVPQGRWGRIERCRRTALKIGRAH